MFDLTEACAKVEIIDRRKGEVGVFPARKKVAIIGFATNTLHLVPWTDPQFEIWGMNQGYMHMLRRGDRHFEMHSPEFTADVRDPNYLNWLKACPVPVYMIDTYDEYPTSVRYPIEEAIHFANDRDYFQSTVAFMAALAGMEGFQEVHLYGINLAIGDEWFYEKANAEWWLGYLEAKGTKIVIPHASSLLKQYRRYGYFVESRPAIMTRALLNARIGEYRTRAEQTSALYHLNQGSMVECEALIPYVKDSEQDNVKSRLTQYRTARDKHFGDLHMMVGARQEAESLIQIIEGTDHGADIVLMPATTAPAPAASSASTT